MSARRSIFRVASCLLLAALLLMAAGGCGGEDSDTDGTVEVSWSSPGRDSEVFGIARLKVSASSDEGISEVSFYCDSVDDAHLIGTVSSPTDSACTQAWYTTAVPNGEHTLYAVALDEQDQSAQASGQ